MWPFYALILAHIIWGVSFIVVKLALQEFPPMTLAFLRFGLATLLLFPFLIISRDPPWTNLRRIFSFLPKVKKVKAAKENSISLMEGKTQEFIDKKDLPRIILIGLLMVSLNIGFFFMGLEKTTVNYASILTLIIPVISVIAGWTILKEKIYVVNIFGVLAGLGGTIVILGVPLISIGAGLSSEVMVGNILIILASLSWVTGALFSKQLLKKYSTLTITFMIFLVGTITFFIPAINEYLQNPAWISHVSYIGVFGVIYATLASSISAYFLFQWGMDQLGLVKADLFQYIEPLVAISLSILLLGEQLRFTFVLGAILIILGVYWATIALPSHKHHKAHRH